MIFVTVGTQLPFDRLIRTIDQWASTKHFADVFAQIGPGEYRPRHIAWAEFLDADECRRKTEQADVVVAHAGMGSILTALEYGRPVVVMPRLSALREHRNDHQLDTARKLLAQGRISVAFDEVELLEKLEYLHDLQPAERISVQASPALIETLRAFVGGKKIILPNVVKSAKVEPSGIKEPNRDLMYDEAGKWDLPSRSTRYQNQSAWRHSNRIRIESTGVRVGLEDRLPFKFDRHQRFESSTIKPRLAAVILLAGRLRLTDLGKRIGRSRLDLPIDANRSLLSYWRDEAAHLAKLWERDHLPVRVLLDQSSTIPTLPQSVPGVTLSLERDQAEFRGTGGVLRDVCDVYNHDDWVLVANAAQILFEPLCDVVNKLADAGGEINVVDDRDGIPNGLILLRCGVVRAIPDIGYHDMKEQVIPTAAKRHTVKVVSTQGLTSQPIHSLKDFTETLRTYHARRSNGRSSVNVPVERWQSHFSICEQGAVVAPSAVIHDAVVLQGAVVEKGAVVVRSVVARGARIAPGRVMVDQIVI